VQRNGLQALATLGARLADTSNGGGGGGGSNTPDHPVVAVQHQHQRQYQQLRELVEAAIERAEAAFPRTQRLQAAARACRAALGGGSASAEPVAAAFASAAPERASRGVRNRAILMSRPVV
jgi:hypothetical protein